MLESLVIILNHTTLSCSRTFSPLSMSSKSASSLDTLCSVHLQMGVWPHHEEGDLVIKWITREVRADCDSPKNTNILNGNAEDLYQECVAYEKAITAVGGIDLFLGGIGAGKFISLSTSHTQCLTLHLPFLYPKRIVSWFARQGDPHREASFADLPTRRWTHRIQRTRFIPSFPNPNQDPSLRDHSR